MDFFVYGIKRGFLSVNFVCRGLHRLLKAFLWENGNWAIVLVHLRNWTKDFEGAISAKRASCTEVVCFANRFSFLSFRNFVLLIDQSAHFLVMPGDFYHYRCIIPQTSN